MPHPAHRRRHRSGDRTESWFQRIALWLLILLVGILLGATLARMQPSPAAVFGLVSVLTAAALIGLSYGVGRLAAAVRNACALYSAHMDVARFMRTNESFRAARRGVTRRTP